MTENKNPFGLRVTDLDSVFSMSVIDKYNLTEGDAFADMFEAKPAVDALCKFAKESLGPAFLPPDFTLHYHEVGGRPHPVAVARAGDFIDITDTDLGKTALNLIAEVGGGRAVLRRHLRIAGRPYDFTAQAQLGVSGEAERALFGLKPFSEPGAVRLACDRHSASDLDVTYASDSPSAERLGKLLVEYQPEFTVGGILDAMRNLWQSREIDGRDGGQRFRVGLLSQTAAFLYSLTLKLCQH